MVVCLVVNVSYRIIWIVMPSFCHHLLSVYKQLWSLFYHSCCRRSLCLWFNFWLHQGKYLNAGQPVTGVILSEAPWVSNSNSSGTLKLHFTLVLPTSQQEHSLDQHRAKCPYILSSLYKSTASLWMPHDWQLLFNLWFMILHRNWFCWGKKHYRQCQQQSR